MRASYGLHSYCITGLLIQACIQAHIDASMVVSTCFLFWSDWLIFLGHLWPPSWCTLYCLYAPHPLQHTSPHMHTGVCPCSLSLSVQVWSEQHCITNSMTPYSTVQFSYCILKKDSTQNPTINKR